MEDICVRASEMLCQVSLQSVEDLHVIWRNHWSALQWTCPFMLPPWLNAWWSVFGRDEQPLVAVVRQGQSIIGIAPLMLQNKTARFLGGPDVCDYFDCVVVQDQEHLFFTTLFTHLSALGYKDLDLGPMHPDASCQKFISVRDLSRSVSCRIEREDVLFELDLPDTWDEFLATLDGKQRHELRRKLRRLYEAGPIRFRRIDAVAQLPEAVENFLRLFTMNREDKAAFMTGSMVSFFRALFFALAEEGLLRLFFLDVDGQPVASVFCFDYQGTRYLYNNGYDAAYQELSVGLMSKVLSLKAAIEEGLRTYNLLKGDETYKTRLGGKTIPLSRCQITLS